MNYAAIKKIDVANGPGVRVSLFVSGCTHHCKGCFNPETWDFKYGNNFTTEVEDEILEALKPDYIKGLSILGGEPFEPVNQKGLLPLLRRYKEQYPGKTIWCYTGYDFEKDILTGRLGPWEITEEMLSYIDILVDGEFVIEKKNPNLRFRGSENQLVIRVADSLSQDKLVRWDDMEGLLPDIKNKSRRTNNDIRKEGALR
ncbi:MAG: anaerobic ribonucleoside-triphosphate reductase activating protein [Phascolarctobacterium sp.]|nr:anaerobic ribonucleoside-triphosphate reductase activating protein [Phascolarctobacterium sp.]